MTLLVTVVLGIACSLAAAELLDFCPSLTEWFISRAVERLPKKYRERYRLEWSGDIDYLRSRRGKLAILFWAATVYASSGRLASQIDTASIAPQEPSDLFLTFLGAGSSLNEKYPFGHDLDIPTIIRQLTDAETKAKAAAVAKKRRKPTNKKRAPKRRTASNRERKGTQLELPTLLDNLPSRETTRHRVASASSIPNTPAPWNESFADDLDIPTIIRLLD